MNAFRESDLESYLDEALPADEMAAIEKAAREDRSLAEALAALHARRDAGVHSVGEIWRRRRLSCPSREQLGGFLLGILPAPHARHIEFHLQTIGCRYCQANLDDLKLQQAQTDAGAPSRRRKYLESSAGYLKEGLRTRG